MPIAIHKKILLQNLWWANGHWNGVKGMVLLGVEAAIRYATQQTAKGNGIMNFFQMGGLDSISKTPIQCIQAHGL